MRTRLISICYQRCSTCLILLVLLLPSMPAFSQEAYPVILDGKIAAGTDFGVGVDDGKHHQRWLKEGEGHLRMEYPGDFPWAAVFITAGGPATPPPRSYVDLSRYGRLALEMKGEAGGECVRVGIKDNDDPDDGTEPKQAVELTKEWKTYELDIAFFKKRHAFRSQLKMTELYVVTEFVFPCGPTQNGAQTVYVKNVKFTN